ncbi:MAG: TatD family hydrolase [Thermodesulfobacteriota bacterium]
MKIFDSHCHINDKSFDKDRDEVIKRASENGITHMLIAGVTIETCLHALEIAEKYSNIYTSVGIHPHDASSCSEESIKKLQKLSESEYVKAWGETGLDFNRMHSPADDQEKWLLRQIDAASEVNLPLIFHERDSEKRFLELIKSSSIKSGVVHCFSGTLDEMKAYLDLGLYIGITGVVTILQRGEQLRQILQYLPEDRILIETDAPYLAPAPQKNKTRRNEPSFLPGVLNKIAEVKNQDPENLSEIIFKNTTDLFNIG